MNGPLLLSLLIGIPVVLFLLLLLLAFTLLVIGAANFPDDLNDDHIETRQRSNGNSPANTYSKNSQRS
jgi:hypothetical protein